MEVIFVDAKDPQGLSNVKIDTGDALMGFNLNEKSQLTKEGVPQHKAYPLQKIVSFGIQRFQKQEERNSVISVAGQALNFRKQHPNWNIVRILRPIYDINPDDTFAAALLDPELGPTLFSHSKTTNSLVTELALWNANKYVYAKEFRPTLLNNALNEFPYPFKDMPGKTRQESCMYYFYDQQAWFAENIERMEPTTRVFPALKFEVLFRNESAALILVESERYGSDDLIAQMYFQMNPLCARVALARRVFKSVKHLITVVNATLVDDTFSLYNYPNVKELNIQEKKMDGDPSWKNLKLTTIGPRKGTVLPFDTVWELTKIAVS
jgi:hypothetical protein